MRVLVVIAVLVLIFAWAGWLKFGSPSGDPTVRVDTEKVRQDTSAIVEKSKEAVDHAAEKIDASIDRDPLSPGNE